MKNIYVVLLCALLSSCLGSAGLQSRLETRQGELSYLHDTQKTAEKKRGTVKLNSFVVDDVLPSAVTVNKTSGGIIPLLFVNIWKEQYQCTLGTAQIANDYKKFIQDSLLAEMQRSGNFVCAEDKGDAELDVHVKKVDMSAPVKSGGSFLFLVLAFSYSSYAEAGPVDVSVSAEVALHRKGTEVFHKDFEGKYRTNILKKDVNVPVNTYLENFTPAMIEALSLAIKDLNEKIVKEINQI